MLNPYRRTGTATELTLSINREILMDAEVAEPSAKVRRTVGDSAGKAKQKPPFRPAKDDTKPLLRDPILRSDPIETEQAVLRLPPFPRTQPNF